MFPPANHVKLDEETVELLTAAINSACSRQFERFRAGEPAVRPTVSFQNEVLRQAPRPPAASGSKGKSSSASRIKKSDKKKQKLEIEISSATSDDSADSVGDLPDNVGANGRLEMDENGVMRE